MPVENTDNRKTSSRRRVLALTALGGVAGVMAFAPSTWRKPIIDSVLLPVHAQTTTPPRVARARVAGGVYEIDTEGVGIRGAQIVFRSIDLGRVYKIRSNYFGLYTIDIPPGRYRHGVGHPDYVLNEPFSFAIYFSDRINTHNFHMKRK